MASSLIPQSGRLRRSAGVTPTLSHWRRLMMAVFLLLLAPMASFAEDDDLDTALILTAKGEVFNKVVAGLTDDLEEDLNFVKLEISKATTATDVSRQIDEHNPKLIVLVENSAIKIYGEYQKANPKKAFPPAVAVAALFVDRFIAKLKNATGIRYEIPAVTSIVNMRQVLSKKVKRVGVVHREWMSGLIAQNAKYCEAEGIELVPIKLPNKDSKMTKKLASGLKSLVKKDVDAIWVLNDNALLNGRTIGGAWLPVMGKAKLPVIVGVKTMLTTKYNFGSFAIVPDHYALGVQAASMIGEIMEEDWDISDRDIEQPISVKKVVNVSVLDNKKVSYRAEGLGNMDEVIR